MGRRKRGRTRRILTYWLGVWNRRQEQRNWQHMGSRWYKSSSRIRIATMKTEVDTAAKRRERRENGWFDGPAGLLVPPALAGRLPLGEAPEKPIPPPARPKSGKAPLRPTSLSPYETGNNLQSQEGVTPSQIAAAETDPRGSPPTSTVSRPGLSAPSAPRQDPGSPAFRSPGDPRLRGAHRHRRPLPPLRSGPNPAGIPPA